MKSTEENVRLKEKLKKAEDKQDRLMEKLEETVHELDYARVSLEKYRLIADFALDWEMWYRPDGSIEYVSPSIQSITGYAPGELINHPELIDKIIFPEDIIKYRQYISDSVGFVTVRQSLNFRILTRTKQLRWCEIKCKSAHNDRGKYLGQMASIRDVTRLMQALGEIKNLSDGKEFETRAKHRYIRELESKDRELVSYLMAISQKNETLQFIRKKLKKQSPLEKPTTREIYSQIINEIDASLFASETWDNFKLHFEKIHSGFFDRLSVNFPSLTPKDKKLCAYLRLQLTTKEIAILLNITAPSAEISRVRLRKKLELKRQDNLVDFINRI